MYTKRCLHFIVGKCCCIWEHWMDVEEQWEDTGHNKWPHSPTRISDPKRNLGVLLCSLSSLDSYRTWPSQCAIVLYLSIYIMLLTAWAFQKHSRLTAHLGMNIIVTRHNCPVTDMHIECCEEARVWLPSAMSSPHPLPSNHKTPTTYQKIFRETLQYIPSAVCYTDFSM